MIVRAYELSLGKRRGKNCIAHSHILHYTNSSWMKKVEAKTVGCLWDQSGLYGNLSKIENHKQKYFSILQLSRQLLEYFLKLFKFKEQFIHSFLRGRNEFRHQTTLPQKNDRNVNKSFGALLKNVQKFSCISLRRSPFPRKN